MIRVRYHWVADPLGGALRRAYDVSGDLPDAMHELLAKLGFHRRRAI